MLNGRGPPELLNGQGPPELLNGRERSESWSCPERRGWAGTRWSREGRESQQQAHQPG